MVAWRGIRVDGYIRFQFRYANTFFNDNYPNEIKQPRIELFNRRYPRWIYEL